MNLSDMVQANGDQIYDALEERTDLVETAFGHEANHLHSTWADAKVKEPWKGCQTPLGELASVKCPVAT